MSVSKEFADYCCDLLAGVGPCVARRMFGGWGVSVDGLTIAILGDLGGGDKLWLKANDVTLAQFQAAGCEQFRYPMKSSKGVELKAMNYFAAPEEAMESAPLMLPWARLALQAALLAHSVKAAKVAKVAKKLPAKTLVKTARPKLANQPSTAQKKR